MSQKEERVKPDALIVRVRKERNYVRVENSTAQDGNLSFKARGLLVYLLSLPDDWRPRISHLVANNPDGEHAIRTAFNELARFGYAELVSVRGDGGRLAGFAWKVYEMPQAHILTDVAVSPTLGKSSTTNNTSPKGIQTKDTLYTPGNDESLSEVKTEPTATPEPRDEQIQEERPPAVKAYLAASRKRRIADKYARLIAKTVRDAETWQITLETWRDEGWVWDACRVLDRYTNAIKALNAAQRLLDRQNNPRDAGSRSRSMQGMTYGEMKSHAEKNRLTIVADYARAEDGLWRCKHKRDR